MADYVVRLTGQDNLSGTIKNVKSAVADLGNSASNNLSKFSEKFERITNSTAPLKKQLRDLKAIMADMNFQGLSGTDEFTQIAMYAGQISDAMGDASAATKRFADDTFALSVASQGLTAITGAATAATGAMNLFGVENENVKEAILKVQSAMAILNGVQAVANALNKDSALMQALKAAKLAITTTATTANTAAETANTVSEVANKAATDASAAAKTRETAAETANTVATGANTVAQNAWNVAKAIGKALLGDFSGLILVAAAGVAAYALATDDAADSQENFNSKLEEQSSEVLNQITTFEQLQQEYNLVKGNTQQLSKWIADNAEKFKILKIKVNDADKAHKIFGGNSKNFISASINRSIAMAEEAMNAEMLGKTIAELSKIYKRFLNGEEVDWVDVRKAVQRVTGRSALDASKMMEAAGFEMESDVWFSNAGGKDPTAAMSKLMAMIIDEQRTKAANGLKQLRDAMFKQMGQTAQDIYTEQENYEDEPKGGSGSGGRHKPSSRGSSGRSKPTAKGGSSGTSEITLTQSEIDSLIKSWAGLNKIIEVAQKKIQSLDKTSKTYNEDLKFYNELILSAQKMKFDLIDTSTVKGLGEAKNQIKTIIDLLPEGSEELETWKNKEIEINKKIAERAAAFVNTGSLDGMGKYKQQMMDLIKIMDVHDPQIAQLARKWYEVDKAEKEAKNTLDQMMNGIDPNSPTALKKKIQELENEKLNLDPEKDLLKISNLDYQIDWLKGELGRKMSVLEGTTVQQNAKLNITFDYKKSNLEKLQERIDYFQTEIDKLKDIKLEDVGDEAFNKAQQSLSIFREELAKTKREATLTEMKEDIKEYAKAVREQAVEGTKNFVSGINSIYTAFDGLAQKMDDAKNGFEQFIAIFDTIFTVVDSVFSTIETINGLIETINMLKGAKEAENTMNEKNTATIIAETVALGGLAAAEGSKAVADAATVEPAMASAVALQTQAAAAEEAAAANMFAAHSSIPFVGAALGAASVGIMEGVLSSIKAVSKFANGGIVGGSSYSGDKLFARVNSGEMILNGRQQKNLFNAIDNNRLGADNAQTISFKIKGSDLYGTLKNYSKIKGKSGVTTGII